MADHSQWSPSGASRWVACPASIWMSSQVPPKGDSVYSREGTAAHQLAEWTLDAELKDCAQFVGRLTDNGIEVTETMAEHVQKYVDYVGEISKAHELNGAETVAVFSEVRVSYSETLGQPDAFGTSDFICVAKYPDGDVIEVADLKYGHNLVYAEENEQMMTYALAVLETYSPWLDKVKSVRMHICMPREDFYDEWETSEDHLLEYSETMSNAACRATDILNGKVEAHNDLRPGEKQCRWCPAFSVCPAAADFSRRVTEVDFDDLDATPAPAEKVRAADMATLEKWAKATDYVQDWAKAVMAELERRLFDGQPSAEYKLVEGKRGARAFTDESAVEGIVTPVLGDKAFKRSLMTPTQLQKLLEKGHAFTWKALQEYIAQSEGRPKVVHVSDKRPAIKAVPVDFDNLNDGDE